MSITVSEAGQRGGLALLRKRGKAHFAEIGARGQASMRKKFPNMATIWGKRGGRPKKKNLKDILGEKLEKV